jgi:hypothetical protein
MLPAIYVRFMSNVDTSGEHWLWIGPTNKDGTGRFNFGSHNFAAHRVSWMMENNRSAEGFHISQSCGVPACIRPSCLTAKRLDTAAHAW